MNKDTSDPITWRHKGVASSAECPRTGPNIGLIHKFVMESAKGLTIAPRSGRLDYGWHECSCLRQAVSVIMG